MHIKTFALALTLVVGISNTMGVPIPSDLDWNLSGPTVDMASSVQAAGKLFNTTTGELHLNSSFCTSLPVTNRPTRVNLFNNRTEIISSYKVTAYSTPNCLGNIVGTWNLNSERPSITFNERKSICSYKLRKNPFPSVTVRVTGENNDILSNTMPFIKGPTQGRLCKHLCGSRNEENYPSSIEVLDQIGKVINQTHNSIELFSQPGCEDGSKLKYQDGRTRITSEPNLPKLTNSLQPVVASFRVDIM